MAFSVNEQGALVRMVEEEIDENEAEQELQEKLDTAQNEVNTHSANVAQAEQELSDIEDQAELKESELSLHKAALEAAQARLQKSETEKDSLTAARELRSQRAESGDEGADDPDTGESEEQAVPVTVVAAEG